MKGSIASLVAFALFLTLAGCGTSEGDPARDDAPGTMHLRIEAGASGPGSKLATIVAQSLFSPEDAFVVDCFQKPHELDGQVFCDELLVVPPGVYEVVVQSAVAGCATELDHYKVIVAPDQTVEVELTLVCGGNSGGLDVVINTEYRPTVQAISFTFEGGGTANKYICQGPCEEDVRVTLQVVDPDNTCDELSGVWRAYDAADTDVTGVLIKGTATGENNGVCLFEALLEAGAPLGDYEIVFTVEDTDGYSTTIEFPVHLIDCGDDLYHSNVSTGSGDFGSMTYSDYDAAYYNTDPANMPEAAPAGPGTLAEPFYSSLPITPYAIVGGVDLGDLTDYLFFFADGRDDANWQGATKGFVGDVAVDGIQADERTSGTVPYAGTIYTNDVTLGAWQGIVDQNPGQASGATGEVARITGLETDIILAMQQINGLAATPGYASVASTSLDGLNVQNGSDELFVINVTSGLNFSSKIYITGDAGDVFVLRWDTDADPSNGYQGQVKPQSGGAIVPLGGLLPSNFIHVAGDINASGGGTTPAAPYPQGPRYDDGTGALITGASDFSGGGFFTGYWLTTGAPTNFDVGTGLYYGDTSSLSNGIFVGGWYSITTKFSMTSGTSGVYVSPNPATTAAPDIDVEKYVSPDGGLTWEDADSPTGPQIVMGTDPQFKYVVTNTGNETLAPVSVVDDQLGVIGVLASLDPGASHEWIVAGTWAAGQQTNLATATGTAGGMDYTDDDPANYFGVTAAIDVEKYVSDDGVTWVDADFPPGPEIAMGTDPKFRFVVTNIGTETLTDVQVSDDIFGVIGMLPSLGSGESFEWIVDGTWAPGQHVDTATATGQFDGQDYTDQDPAHYFGSYAPSIDVQKYVSVDEGLTWDDADTAPGPYLDPLVEPWFKFVVTNDGQAPLTDVVVTDDVFGLIGMVPELAPGDSYEWIIVAPAPGVCI